MRSKQSASVVIVGTLKTIGYLISKTFWFIRFSGRENIPPRRSGSYVIAANHQTYVDPVWISIPIHRPLRFMAFDTAFKWRFVGPLIRYLGAFPVPTGDFAGTRDALKEALAALKDGDPLVVFPEGGREFADGAPLPFKTGALRIAQQAGVPVMPVTIKGGNRIWPRNQKWPALFRRVEVIYHPLMKVAQKSESRDLESATDRLLEIIESPLDRA